MGITVVMQCRCVSFSPDGTKVASGSGDIIKGEGEVKLWDVTGNWGLPKLTLKGHSWCAECVVFSRWDEGCVGVYGQDGEGVGCDEWGVSTDAAGAF